jgi:hypothetical protein
MLPSLPRSACSRTTALMHCCLLVPACCLLCCSPFTTFLLLVLCRFIALPRVFICGEVPSHNCARLPSQNMPCLLFSSPAVLSASGHAPPFSHALDLPVLPRAFPGWLSAALTPLQAASATPPAACSACSATHYYSALLVPVGLPASSALCTRSLQCRALPLLSACVPLPHCLCLLHCTFFLLSRVLVAPRYRGLTGFRVII